MAPILILRLLMTELLPLKRLGPNPRFWSTCTPRRNLTGVGKITSEPVVRFTAVVSDYQLQSVTVQDLTGHT